ncbi:MAG: hypothetical protein R2822_23130 [Spirosomataceae bacterium]
MVYKANPEGKKIILKLIENQGYGGAKIQEATASESRERGPMTKHTVTSDSRKVASPTESNYHSTRKSQEELY